VAAAGTYQPERMRESSRARTEEQCLVQTDEAHGGDRAVLAVTSLPALAAAAPQADELARAAAAGGPRTLDDTGNMIFFHPDGTDAAYWEAGRIYWDGPDAVSQWDLLPEMTVYRGHMADQLDGTSNGGATVHAFGFKVDGPGSFGTDSGAADVHAGDVDPPRRIDALSGYPGSLAAGGR
jgi:alkaline phosphatase